MDFKNKKNRKMTFLGLFLGISISLFGQQKIMTQKGITQFEASMPAFEEVKATSKTSICALNTSTGDIASIILVKSFVFKLALMQEHFNENYMESDTYPKATFKGKIQDFDWNKLNSQKQDYVLKGTFQIHGKSKDMDVPAKLTKIGNTVQITATIDLNTDDFNIDLPILIRSKVSKQVHVTIDYTLQ